LFQQTASLKVVSISFLRGHTNLWMLLRLNLSKLNAGNSDFLNFQIRMMVFTVCLNLMLDDNILCGRIQSNPYKKMQRRRYCETLQGLI
jgi:uncharacterized Tic20 family protein